MKTLYISDLDGTLLNNNKEISKSSIDKLNKAISSGVYFTIATARSASTAIDIVKDIKINAPIIMMNGVFVYDISTGKYLHHNSIAKDICHDIIDILSPVHHLTRMFGFNGEGMEVYCTSGKLYTQLKSDEIKPHKEIVHIASFHEKTTDLPVVSFVVVGDFQELSPVYRLIQHRQDISTVFYEDVYDKGCFWIEIYCKDVTKAKGASFVKDWCKAKSVVGFGDNLNDIDLMEYADIGCAVANALEPVKKSADIVLEETNHQDAVANFIMEQIKLI